jgi:hypothetical protein
MPGGANKKTQDGRAKKFKMVEQKLKKKKARRVTY